jgi:hypothetical protein
VKNIYHVTRPIWSEGYKGILTILFGLAANSFITYNSKAISKYLLGGLCNNVPENILSLSVSFLSVTSSTIIAFIILIILKKIKTRHYPSSYIYCFARKENEKGEEVVVIGYFRLSNDDDGNILAQGSSFDLTDTGLVGNTRVRWQSDLIASVKKNNMATSSIIYSINNSDAKKRSYTHGTLEFRHTPYEKTIVTNGYDVYHGQMQIISQSSEAVIEDSYAEKVNDALSETELRELLETYGKKLKERWKRSMGRA